MYWAPVCVPRSSPWVTGVHTPGGVVIRNKVETPAFSLGYNGTLILTEGENHVNIKNVLSFLLGAALMSLAFLCFVIPTDCEASYAVHWTSINVSTPQGVTHYADCLATRLRILPHSIFDSELLATCSSSTSSGPVGGPASFGDAPFVRVRINAPSLDRGDCYFVDIYDINPSVALEIECGWSYDEFKDGFER